MRNGRAILQMQLRKKKRKTKNLTTAVCLVQLGRIYSSKQSTIEQLHILFELVTSLQTTGEKS